MLSTLRLTYLTCWAYCMHLDLEPWQCKKSNTFSSIKLLTQVTVADKLVLMKKPFVHRLMYCLFAVSSRIVQRTSLTVNIVLSDVTNRYYTMVFSGSRKNPNPQVHHIVGNSESLVSHWNGGTSGLDFSAPTEHQ